MTDPKPRQVFVYAPCMLALPERTNDLIAQDYQVIQLMQARDGQEVVALLQRVEPGPFTRLYQRQSAEEAPEDTAEKN